MLRFRPLLLSLLMAGSAVAATPAKSHPSAAHGMAAVRRVVLVILENEDAERARRQPFLGELASGGAYLSNYHALIHPSYPNYVAMVSGDTWGIKNDVLTTVDVKHLGDLLEKSGRDWRVYAEDHPPDRCTNSDKGLFAARHVPFLSFADVRANPTHCVDHIRDASGFASDAVSGHLPQFTMYIPNIRNDGHDTNIEFADKAMRSTFASLLRDHRFTDGTLLIVTFDESADERPGKNVVDCTFWGAGVAAGTVSNALYDHYSLLRTLEAIFHVGTLTKNDAAANVIDDVWAK